jgi:wyosine [tRNA(Phe)-imidazoG37] synthetase (radical SAM superfamily)
MKKHIYGPVPSRRLGFSLGIDIIPYKTCTYNCIYCQLKETSNLTTERKSFVDAKEILQEVKDAISKSNQIDYLTFAGSGEPTLNRDLGWLIDEIKKISDIPIVVLTNGALLWMKEVREDLMNADIVVPSLDSATEEGFRRINCPAPSLKLKNIKQGLKDFSLTFPGKLHLEIMLVKDINNTLEEIEAFTHFIPQLKLDKIQLNTVVRPPRLSAVQPVSQKEMEEIKAAFQKVTDADVEIIASFARPPRSDSTIKAEEAILELLERRPCKAQEMAASLGIHFNEILKYINLLEKEKKIKRVPAEKTSEDYYALVNNKE